MLRYFVKILFLLSFIAQAAFAAPTAPQHTKRTIASINRALPRFKKTEKLVLGTDEGGQLTAWKNGRHIVKVKLLLRLSTNNLETSYYFHNQKLIGVEEHRQYFVWDEARESIDRSKNGERLSAIYYFQNRQRVHYKGEGKGRATTALLADAAQVLRMAAKNANTLYIQDF